MAELRDRVSRRGRPPRLGSRHRNARGVLSRRPAPRAQPFRDGARARAAALACAGGGLGLDGHRAAAEHRERDQDHDTRRHGRAGAGQQARGAGRRRGLVQRNGGPAQDVVRQLAGRGRHAKAPRARTGGERGAPARQRRPAEARCRCGRHWHLGLGRGAGPADMGRFDVPALRGAQGGFQRRVRGVVAMPRAGGYRAGQCRCPGGAARRARVRVRLQGAAGGRRHPHHSRCGADHPRPGWTPGPHGRSQS